jgi:hypothetical protein
MPIYQLVPLNPSQPEWKTSTFDLKCRVHASNEERARKYVDREFRITTYIRSNDGAIPISPWLDPELVECNTVEEASPPDYRDGLILTEQDLGGLTRKMGTFIFFLSRNFQPPSISTSSPRLRRVASFSYRPLTPTAEANQSFSEIWRMGWDSNPRDACTPAGFQDQCLQPLGHPSIARLVGHT